MRGDPGVHKPLVRTRGNSNLTSVNFLYMESVRKTNGAGDVMLYNVMMPCHLSTFTSALRTAGKLPTF